VCWCLLLAVSNARHRWSHRCEARSGGGAATIVSWRPIRFRPLHGDLPRLEQGAVPNRDIEDAAEKREAAIEARMEVVDEEGGVKRVGAFAPPKKAKQSMDPRCSEFENNGLCRNAARVYLFNKALGRCSRALVGACPGYPISGFRTFEECAAVCKR
ncbi:hypothetical protein PENTCL1PPCAC_13691, partial [Pristionchus entomophagus]